MIREMPDGVMPFMFNLTQLQTIEKLGRAGVKIWPHPEVDHLTRRKYCNLTLLAPAVRDFAEHPRLIKIVEEGIAFLADGFVIKTEYGAEGRQVYKDNLPSTRQKFTDAFQKYGSTLVFFAMGFNRVMLELGEVRVFLAFGEVLQIVHTLPTPKDDEQHLPRTLWTDTSSEICNGYLVSPSAIA